jgi:hypothetical protein
MNRPLAVANPHFSPGVYSLARDGRVRQKGAWPPPAHRELHVGQLHHEQAGITAQQLRPSAIRPVVRALCPSMPLGAKLPLCAAVPISQHAPGRQAPSVCSYPSVAGCKLCRAGSVLLPPRWALSVAWRTRQPSPCTRVLLSLSVEGGYKCIDPHPQCAQWEHFTAFSTTRRRHAARRNTAPGAAAGAAARGAAHWPPPAPESPRPAPTTHRAAWVTRTQGVQGSRAPPSGSCPVPRQAMQIASFQLPSCPGSAVHKPAAPICTLCSP